MNKTEKPRSNSLLIYRVQESEGTSCLCYSLWALGSSSAAELHHEALRVADDHCCAWASWGPSLPHCSASCTCNRRLASAGLWKAKWCPQSLLSIPSSLHASRHLDKGTTLCFQRDVRNAGRFKGSGWARSLLLKCVCLGLTNSGFPLQAWTFLLKVFEFQLWIPAASISSRQILSQIPVVLV